MYLNNYITQYVFVVVNFSIAALLNKIIDFEMI